MIRNNLVVRALIPVEVEVRGCGIRKVLKALDLLRWNLSLSFVVAVLRLYVLFWLEVQNLSLILFDRLRLVRLIEGDVRLFVRSKRLLN